MKAIKDMNISECSNEILSVAFTIHDNKHAQIPNSAWRLEEVSNRLRELHEQTRWIPVSERLPTEADFGIDKRFRVWLGGVDSTAVFAEGKLFVWDDEAYNPGWTEHDPTNPRVAFTHWQRITPPEGV